MLAKKIIKVKTKGYLDILDITEAVRESLPEMVPHNSSGLLNVYLKNTTASLIINENERGLIKDMINFFEKIIPVGGYQHDATSGEGNAHAHLRNIITNATLTIPVEKGKLELGTWQRILLVEWDRARAREIILTFVG